MRTFERIDFALEPLPKGEYEECKFVSCNFANLSGFKFLECEFVGCNFSAAKLGATAFRTVTFKECKMLGLRFEDCDTFALEMRFEQCLLQHASFYKLKLKNTSFKGSLLKEADFTEADLSSADFEGCDLQGTVFDRTILEKADFRQAVNYSLDPEKNKLKKARFSLHGVQGLLGKYDIQIS